MRLASIKILKAIVETIKALSSMGAYNVIVASLPVLAETGVACPRTSPVPSSDQINRIVVGLVQK